MMMKIKKNLKKLYLVALVEYLNIQTCRIACSLLSICCDTPYEEIG